MNTAGALFEELYLSIDATSEDEQARVRRTLNMAYYDLVRAASWVLCRATASMDFSTQADTTGLWLPANLAGIDAVYDSDRVYSPADKASNLTEKASRYRYYISGVCSSPLYQQRGVTIEQGSSAISFSPALATDPTGEFITISGRIGFYKFTAVGTITPKFMDDRVSNEWFQIRPEGTQKMALMDNEGNSCSASVTVDYWVLPPPLIHPSQMILLPTTEALYFKTIIRLLQYKANEGKAYSYIREYRDAYNEMLQRNPEYICPVFSEFRDGETLGWGADDQ